MAFTLEDMARKKISGQNQATPNAVMSYIQPQATNNQVDPIKANLQANPTYKSPAQQSVGITPPQPAPFVDPYAADNEKLRTAIKQPNASNYDYNTDPAFQALKSTYGNLGDAAYSNTLGGRGEGISSYIASAASQAKQGYNERLMALVPGMQQNNYNQQQDAYSNQVGDYNRGLERSALAYTQNRNTISDNRNAVNDAYVATDRATAATDKSHKQYADSIAGLGDNMDYQQQYNNVRDDGDPTNDWKLPIIMQERTKKQAGNLERYAATAGQYNDNYQQEIDNLTKVNPNDPKIPVLAAMRQLKVEKLRQEQITKDAANSANAQKDATLAETIRSNMASEGISQQNANTAAYNAEKKPATVTTADKNKVFANTYTRVKALSWDDAIAELQNGADDYIEALGVSGYRSLWNEVLRDAIKAGAAKPMSATPKNEDPLANFNVGG